MSTPVLSAKERTRDLPTFKTVLACTDFSPLARAALESAVELGQKLGTKRIHIAHVVATHGEGIVEAMAAKAAHEIAMEDRNRAIDAIESIELPPSKATISREVRVGEPAKTIALLAGEIGADLIVVGSHGRGMLGRAFYGSVAQTLVRLAPCPVLIIYDETKRASRFEDILAAIDLNDPTEPVLAHAIAVAKAFKGDVRAVSVFEGDDPASYGLGYGRPYEKIEAELRSALAATVGRVPAGDTKVTLEVVADEKPARGLLELATREGPDLIVIGSSGKNALERILFGSTSTKVVEKSNIPLLVVPKAGLS